MRRYLNKGIALEAKHNGPYMLSNDVMRFVDDSFLDGIYDKVTKLLSLLYSYGYNWDSPDLLVYPTGAKEDRLQVDFSDWHRKQADLC